MRSFLEVRQLAEPDLVQDPSRELVAKRIDLRALIAGEHTKGRDREVWRERKRLVARYEAVSPEDGHEPGQSGRRHGLAREELGSEAKCGEIDEAALVDVLERIPIGLQTGRGLEPVGKAHADIGFRLLLAVAVLDRAGAVNDGADRDARAPFGIRRELKPE